MSNLFKRILALSFLTILLYIPVAFPLSAHAYNYDDLHNGCECVCQNGNKVEVCPRGVYSTGGSCTHVYDCHSLY